MNVSNIIIITILILVLIWIINRWFLKSNIIYDIMCNASDTASTENIEARSGNYLSTNKNVIFNNDFNENNTHNFMLSVWFYIDNWGNFISNEKNILYMASESNAKTVPGLKTGLTGISKKVCRLPDGSEKFKNLNIALDKYENNLLIDIETYSEDSTDCSGSYFTRYIVKNIPVQKWNNLTLSIDTKTFDVYLDGKLRNSFILHGTYKNKLENSETKNIYLGEIDSNNIGFEGFITRIRYEPTSINPQEAYNIYKKGINASLAKSLFNRYSLKVSFLEYNKERGSFSL